MLSPPKPLGEIQPNLVRELLTCIGRAVADFFAPPTGEGSKGQISLNFNYKVNFKDFYTKIGVCFSQIKDIKHIKQDFHSIAWLMPQGWDFGALGVPRGTKQKFFEHDHVAYQINGEGEHNIMQVKFSPYSQTGDLGSRSKGQIVNFS